MNLPNNNAKAKKPIGEHRTPLHPIHSNAPLVDLSSSFLCFFQGSLRPPSKVGRSSRTKPSIPPAQPTAPIRPVERDRTANSILPQVAHQPRVKPETSAANDDGDNDATESDDDDLVTMLAGRRLIPPARLTPAPVRPHSRSPTPSSSVDADTAPLAHRTFLLFPLPFPFTALSHPSSPSQPPAKHTSTVRHTPILTIPKFMSLTPEEVHASAKGGQPTGQESVPTSPRILPLSQQERGRPTTPPPPASDPACTSSPSFILSSFFSFRWTAKRPQEFSPSGTCIVFASSSSAFGILLIPSIFILDDVLNRHKQQRVGSSPPAPPAPPAPPRRTNPDRGKSKEQTSLAPPPTPTASLGKNRKKNPRASSRGRSREQSRKPDFAALGDEAQNMLV